ncbi:hypothetical protein A3Q56_00023 [Intoshia linei]|uniref:Uncharacterized protein n=1 Tax=Intoshia linei TaxID=1819745 RepID=A0A177BD34_9BILA|nr:hypothetical protein A3Q56_00023 [Intoshia linei]
MTIRKSKGNGSPDINSEDSGHVSNGDANVTNCSNKYICCESNEATLNYNSEPSKPKFLINHKRHNIHIVSEGMLV